MKLRPLLLLTLTLALGTSLALAQQPQKPAEGPYPVDPDSVKQEGVPAGGTCGRSGGVVE